MTAMPYAFEGPDGITFGPDWDEACPSCSVSRAPYEKLASFRERMGWSHIYSTFGRGIEELHNGYQYLDLTALGRQEEWEEPQGRAVPLRLQVAGPAMRPPDEYDAT